MHFLSIFHQIFIKIGGRPTEKTARAGNIVRGLAPCRTCMDGRIILETAKNGSADILQARFSGLICHY